jgi:hydroxymethylpyrimidine pyrophosphatase-like HAD family hydrolase
MRYHVLAIDYDGTLARDGVVDQTTVTALKKVLDSGRELILVTGRELYQLLTLFPEIQLFTRVVAENGALLCRPASKEETLLCHPPPPAFLDALQLRGVAPLSAGRVIVATWRPQEAMVLRAIRELGLELQIIFNKESVMVLPSGVNKARGLTAALAELAFSADQVVGVGDAENDHSFLRMCGYAAAVANAVPAVKETADIVLTGDHGAGVAELIDRLLTCEEDLRRDPEKRHASR